MSSRMLACRPTMRSSKLAAVQDRRPEASRGAASGFSPLTPGAEMVRAAAESLAEFSNVEFVQATFEAWPTNLAGFRLIIAAQSWHWVSPEVRFAKAAEVLSPD